MLVFSAITPHPPILIPTIGRESLEQIKKTCRAMEELGRDFYLAQPETAIIISPHGKLFSDAFTLNSAPEFSVDFKAFGDLETKLEFSGDIGLGHKIKETLETKIPLQLISEPELDHGAGVPLYYLNQKIKAKIVPLGYAFFDLKKHFELGQALAEIIHREKRRIAVIASGDLSHSLTPAAPAGYMVEGKKFDEQLIKLIKEKNFDAILNLDKNLVENANECGLRSIVILAGILAEYNFEPQVLSYEGPFGVGYLVCNFELNK